MGHDHHFLSRLDRLTREQIDLALALYRDTELVRYLLARANLHEGDARVALSLGRADAGPYLVLATDGHFVTCLGEGMVPTGLTVRDRSWLDDVATSHTVLRQRLAHARTVTGDSSATAALIRSLTSRSNLVPREDSRAFLALAPVLGTAPVMLVTGGTRFMREVRPTLGALKSAHKPAVAKVVSEYWRAMWAAATAMLILAHGGEEPRSFILEAMQSEGALTATLIAHGVLAVTARAAYFVASLGEPAIDVYEAQLETAVDPILLVDALIALNALAGSRADFAVRVRGIFGRLRDARVETPAAEMLATLAGLILERTVDEQVDACIALGAEALVRIGAESVNGAPYHYDDGEQVPPDLAKTVALNVLDDSLNDSGGLLLSIWTAALAGRSSAEDFFFTEDQLRHLPLGVDPNDLLAIAQRRLKFRLPKTEPVRAKVEPGRNDPCSCGSGKKWKKCCGAPPPP